MNIMPNNKARNNLMLVNFPLIFLLSITAYTNALKTSWETSHWMHIIISWRPHVNDFALALWNFSYASGQRGKLAG